MDLIVAFVNKDNPVEPGKCVRCMGYGTIKMQCMGGEVRYGDCSRCQGTGKEPQGFWDKFWAKFRIEQYP